MSERSNEEIAKHLSGKLLCIKGQFNLLEVVEKLILEALDQKDAEYQAKIAALEEENQQLKNFFRLIDEERAKFKVADSKLVISLQAKLHSLEKVVSAARWYKEAYFNSTDSNERNKTRDRLWDALREYEEGKS